MKQRIILLVLAASVVVFVSACTASLVNDPGSGQSTIALHAPAANLTPTPTAPPYTIAEFANNETPNVTSTDTVYVIFHLGDQPVGGASVVLNFYLARSGTPVVQLNNEITSQQTAPDGWAAFSLNFIGLTSEGAVLVDVTVSYNGKTYVRHAAYAFTPVQASPTPSPKPGG